MAKVSKKSEKISAFGGIFFVLDRFDRILSSVIDSHLGLRSKLIGYQSTRLYGQPSPFSAVAATAWKTSTEVIHEPEHRVPAYHRHGCKLLPIHRGIAAHGRPLWNQGHGQGKELPLGFGKKLWEIRGIIYHVNT